MNLVKTFYPPKTIDPKQFIQTLITTLRAFRVGCIVVICPDKIKIYLL